jgi:hypothetical protein
MIRIGKADERATVRWSGIARDRATKPPNLIRLIVAGVLMSRLLLTDEPPMPYCPHCGQPMKLVGISRLLGRSCPTLLELYCASCDHEEIKEDRPTVCAE